MILTWIPTFGAARLPIAATPRALKMEEPTIVPRPKSERVMNVPMRFVKSSGVDVAIAIKVAAATS